MHYREHITSEELAALPQGAFDGEIAVVDTPEELEKACREMAKCRILGFDTETRPSFQKGRVNKMALLQLSSREKAYLVRLNRLDISPALKAVFEDDSIAKVGASIRDDIRGLRKWGDFTPQGFVDIQSMVPDYGIVDLSVRKVTAIVLGIRISKAQRLSNWEAESLTVQQQLYAATDAWACREIYMKLKGL